MTSFTAASKADFQHQLQAALAQHVSEKALPQIAQFAEQFFGIIALDELTQRRLSDLPRRRAPTERVRAARRIERGVGEDAPTCGLDQDRRPTEVRQPHRRAVGHALGSTAPSSALRPALASAQSSA